MKRNLISLFAGAGGLDLGLEMAGFSTRLANEIEPHACESLRLNKAINDLSQPQIADFIQDSLTQRCHQKITPIERKQLVDRLMTRDRFDVLRQAEIIEGDIREIPSNFFREKLGGEELFCIAGGPPCQPFSKAGKQKSLDCTKNGDLFFEFVRLVSDLQPKWFVFENVKGLTFTKTDVLYLDCLECKKAHLAPFHIRQDYKISQLGTAACESCGSSRTAWKVSNERGGSLKIILNEFQKLGYSCDFSILNAADFGAPQTRERLFIIGNRDGKTIIWPKPTHQKPANHTEKQPDLFKHDDSRIKPWVSMKDALWKHDHWAYGALGKTAVLWVKNVVRPHDEPVTWTLDRPSPTIGAHQGAKLAIAPHGVPDAQIYRQQWHTLGRRQGDTPPVPVEHRYLTDEELLLLQTFPKWWYLHGTRMQRAFQIGNAVPPILGKVIGEAIIHSDETQQ